MAKADKRYGGPLYAGILLWLSSRPGKSCTTADVCDAILAKGYGNNEYRRVLNCLNRLYESGHITREMRRDHSNNISSYLFTYHNKNV